MVLGTAHLSEKNQALSKNLEPLLKILKDWKPTRIAIEDRKPEDIHKAYLHSSFDTGYKKLIEIFDGKDIKRAQQIYKKHRTTYEKSLAKVSYYLKNENNLKDSEREQLVIHLLATFDVPSATLQWAKIGKNYKDKTYLFSKEEKATFNNQLSSQDEIYLIAVSLAYQLNHPMIYSVDSQEDGVSMVTLPEKELENFYSAPNSKNFNNSQFMKDQHSAVTEATKTGDILSVIDFVNKNAAKFDEQWDWLLNINQEKGIHKLRYANWEQRNIKIFSNIQELVSSAERERVLVLIGAAHKAILDRYLMQNQSVEVIHFDQIHGGVSDK